MPPSTSPALPYRVCVLAGALACCLIQAWADGVPRYSMKRETIPRSMASDHAGNVYLADEHFIRRLTPDGKLSTLAAHGFNNSASDTYTRFIFPSGLTVDNTGTLYVADRWDSTIRKITPDGTMSLLAGKSWNKLERRPPRDGKGAQAEFFGSDILTADNGGNVYVVDSRSIRKITSDGVVTTLAGQPGMHSGLDAANNRTSGDGSGRAANFSYIAGLAVDRQGSLYASDYERQTIRKISRDGAVSTLAGLPGHAGAQDGKGSTARFNFPTGIAVDDDGNVIVADSHNYTLRKITPDGTVSTLAGRAGCGGERNGAGAEARFGLAQFLAAGADGSINVEENLSDSVRVMDAEGRVGVVGRFVPGVVQGFEKLGRDAGC